MTKFLPLTSFLVVRFFLSVLAEPLVWNEGKSFKFGENCLLETNHFPLFAPDLKISCHCGGESCRNVYFECGGVEKSLTVDDAVKQGLEKCYEIRVTVDQEQFEIKFPKEGIPQINVAFSSYNHKQSTLDISGTLYLKRFVDDSCCYKDGLDFSATLILPDGSTMPFEWEVNQQNQAFSITMTFDEQSLRNGPFLEFTTVFTQHDGVYTKTVPILYMFPEYCDYYSKEQCIEAEMNPFCQFDDSSDRCVYCSSLSENNCERNGCKWCQTKQQCITKSESEKESTKCEDCTEVDQDSCHLYSGCFNCPRSVYCRNVSCYCESDFCKTCDDGRIDSDWIETKDLTCCVAEDCVFCDSLNMNINRSDLDKVSCECNETDPKSCTIYPGCSYCDGSCKTHNDCHPCNELTETECGDSEFCEYCSSLSLCAKLNQCENSCSLIKEHSCVSPCSWCDSSKTCLGSKEECSSESSFSITLILICVLIPVFVVAVVALIVTFVLVRKRRQREERSITMTMFNTSEMTTMDTTSIQ